MIQRIQSIYLLLTFLLSVIFLGGDFFNFGNDAGTRIMMDSSGLWKSGGDEELVRTGNHFILTILFIFIGIISVSDIFLYRKRKVQLFLAKILCLLTAASAALTIFYIIYITGRYEVSVIPGLRMFIPFAVSVLCLLAHRGIRKDDDLVRSYDRLR
ncbi:MAG TPA: DUF4293 domain-containing protein [Bacteroidales bacterium]|jgi:hypothetical protein|nr:DUF4293 domain-containing protein [Bacteroidales bacterium]